MIFVLTSCTKLKSKKCNKMNRFLRNLFFLILIISFSCSQDSEIKSGIYLAKNNELFYAIDINKSQNILKIYMLESFSQNNYEIPQILGLNIVEKENSVKDFKIFSKGNFKIKGDRLIIENLESNILPSTRPKTIEGKISDENIIISSEILSKYLFGKSISFKSNEIEFVKEK
jgi:hypothetical protein